MPFSSASICSSTLDASLQILQAHQIKIKINITKNKNNPSKKYNTLAYKKYIEAEKNLKDIFTKNSKSELELFNGCKIYARSSSANAARGISAVSILIFDEATSALDYESESIIQNNLKQICKNRTVIIIAHRLSTLKDADAVMVVEKGSIAEYGTMQSLIDKKGIYYHLLLQQQMNR